MVREHVRGGQSCPTCKRPRATRLVGCTRAIHRPSQATCCTGIPCCTTHTGAPRNALHMWIPHPHPQLSGYGPPCCTAPCENSRPWAPLVLRTELRRPPPGTGTGGESQRREGEPGDPLLLQPEPWEVWQLGGSSGATN